MKQKRPDFLPTSCHINWQNCPAFTKEILDETKVKLTKIQPANFNPHPKLIFDNFSIDPDSIKMILVNDVFPLNVSNDTIYEDYPPILKEIWDKLAEHEGWDDAVELHTQPDLSDFLYCLKLNTSLATNSIGVWDKFMHELFKWFGESTDRYLFVFLTEKSFNQYSKYVSKKHEVQYLFQPDAIKEYFKTQWGITYGFGLPF